MASQEGCLVEGVLIINKVPGNFHISSHAFGEALQRIYMEGRHLDFTHHINHLSFGIESMQKRLENDYGEKFTNDMDGITISQAMFVRQGQMLANYYLDVN